MKQLQLELRKWFRKYSDFLVSWYARAGVSCIVLVYWGLAACGCSQVRIYLSSRKLFLQGSSQIYAADVQDLYVYKEGGQVNLFISNPGDLRNQSRLKQVMDFVGLFEKHEHSMGRDASNFWIRHYMPFIGYQEGRDVGFDASYIQFNYRYILAFAEISS